MWYTTQSIILVAITYPHLALGRVMLNYLHTALLVACYERLLWVK